MTIPGLQPTTPTRQAARDVVRRTRAALAVANFFRARGGSPPVATIAEVPLLDRFNAEDVVRIVASALEGDA